MFNFIITSTDGTHFTDAIAKDGGIETETGLGLPADGQGEIKSVMIRSADKRAWAVEIMDDDGNPMYIHKFDEDDATQYSNENFYCASVNWLIPQRQTYPYVIVGIRNNSSIAKVASSTFVLKLSITK